METKEPASGPAFKGDPFFEQLKADILEGAAAADRGELIPLDQAIAHARAAIDKVAARRESEQR